MATRPLYREHAIKDLLDKKAFVPNTILEFGYGSGEMLENFSQWFPASKVFGYDFSSHVVDFVKGKRIKAQLLSSEKECKRRKYSMLCAFEVLEHIEDDISALENWEKLLETGGSILISVPAHMKKWQVNDDISGHFRRYEKKELSAKLSKAGFTDVEVINYGYPMTIFLDIALKCLASREAKTSHGNMENRTKVSGLRKVTGLKGKLFSFTRTLSFLFCPLFAFQRAFYKYDLSSGYIAIARKA